MCKNVFHPLRYKECISSFTLQAMLLLNACAVISSVELVDVAKHLITTPKLGSPITSLRTLSPNKHPNAQAFESFLYLSR